MPNEPRPRRNGAADQSHTDDTARSTSQLVRRPQSEDRGFRSPDLLEVILGDVLGNVLRIPRCSWEKRTKGRQSCGRRACIPCRLTKGLAVADNVLAALQWTERNGLKAHFLTVASGSGEFLHHDVLLNLWNRLVRNFRKTFPDLAWIAHRLAWGLYSDGRIHLHVVTIGEGALTIRRGNAPFPSPHLRRCASAIGIFVWIEPVTNSRRSHTRLANYFAENGMRFSLAHARSAKYLHAFPRASGQWPKGRR
jgi:hypothetical protein